MNERPEAVVRAALFPSWPTRTADADRTAWRCLWDATADAVARAIVAERTKSVQRVPAALDRAARVLLTRTTWGTLRHPGAETPAGRLGVLDILTADTPVKARAALAERVGSAMGRARAHPDDQDHAIGALGAAWRATLLPRRSGKGTAATYWESSLDRTIADVLYPLMRALVPAHAPPMHHPTNPPGGSAPVEPVDQLVHALLIGRPTAQEARTPDEGLVSAAHAARLLNALWDGMATVPPGVPAAVPESLAPASPVGYVVWLWSLIAANELPAPPDAELVRRGRFATTWGAAWSGWGARLADDALPFLNALADRVEIATVLNGAAVSASAAPPVRRRM